MSAEGAPNEIKFAGFIESHRNKVMHAFYLTGTALGLAVAIPGTAIAPLVVLSFCAAWNIYDGLCAIRDSLEAAEKAEKAEKAESAVAVAKEQKTRMLWNIASSAALIIGTIAACCMLASPAAPVIMAAVFAFAMVCSYKNRELDKEKHGGEKSQLIGGAQGLFYQFLPASDGEAQDKKFGVNFSDKKSWALCIIGMTAVAVMTGLGSMGTIPAVVVAGFALLSAIYRVANSYYNKKAQTPFGNASRLAGGGQRSTTPVLAEPPLDHT
jgi:hypothetical protein